MCDQILLIRYAGKFDTGIIRKLSNVPSPNIGEVTETDSSTSPVEYRREIILKSPVAGAKYLRTVLDGFVEEILRFNRKSHRPYRAGGIFGVIELFFHSVKETGRKFLHVHGIARAASANKTSSESEQIKQNEEQERRVSMYGDFVINAQLPVRLIKNP